MLNIVRRQDGCVGWWKQNVRARELRELNVRVSELSG